MALISDDVDTAETTDPPRRSRRSVGICGIGDQSNRIAVDGLKAAAVAVEKAVAARAIGESGYL